MSYYGNISYDKDCRSGLDFLNMIRVKLEEKKQTLKEAILLKKLYLRVSVIGICNLYCPFCHNEGAPKDGILDLDLAARVMKEAFKVGYRRVQFAGGEPLLHPNIEGFIREARRIYGDVGITTNGIYLPQKIDSLIEEGISRIHISLQMEIMGKNERGEFCAPVWVSNVLKLTNQKNISVRVNLPVPWGKINKFKPVVKEILSQNCNIEIFPIISVGETYSESNYVEKLIRFVAEQNQQFSPSSDGGKACVRTYLHPEGIRCFRCDYSERCREGSRSLRVGADRILRPCLASRRWDIPISQRDLSKQIEEASLLAIDFTW